MKTQTGDLLDFKGVSTIMHCANCQNTMGSGIALQIKKRYPEAYKADTTYNDYAHQVGERILGEYSVVHVDSGNTDYVETIVNLYGQFNYGTNGKSNRYLNYAALFNAIINYVSIETIDLTLDKGNLKIGVPYLMGCDRAGGDWNIVSQFLDDLEELYPVEFVIFKLK